MSDDSDDRNSEKLSALRHDMRQPINVIAMTVANLRARAERDFAGMDPAYLLSKLEKIDRKLIELEEFIEQI